MAIDWALGKRDVGQSAVFCLKGTTLLSCHCTLVSGRQKCGQIRTMPNKSSAYMEIAPGLCGEFGLLRFSLRLKQISCWKVVQTSLV